MTYGAGGRKDAQCSHCGALERHRLLWLFLKEKTNLFDGHSQKMLHVAPESCFESKFKKILGSNYLTADLFSRAMVTMDICNIQYPDQSFDAIYCNHVLEHVIDDRKAIREFFRVLRNDGWAILNVPIMREKTFEDSSIINPKERLKVFGQEDHVRCYGLDYVERLRDSGFSVEVINASDLVDDNDAEKMGLTSASGEIFYCTKQ
ncbi:MAG: class I SAM-dependent methyltransferase [Leptolyngbyaceae cyanobacterium]